MIHSVFILNLVLSGESKGAQDGRVEAAMKIGYFHNIVCEFHAEHRPKQNLNMVNLQ